MSAHERQIEVVLLAHKPVLCSESRPGFHRRWVLCECGDSIEYTEDEWETHRIRALVDQVAPDMQEARAEAWDEGWEACHAFMGRGIFPPRTNPYRRADQ